MTKIVTLEGQFQWAKVFPDNRDMKGYDDEYVACDGAYVLDVLLDDVQLGILQDSGSKIEGVEDEETGLRRVKFKRKHKVMNSKTGEVIEAFSGPPRVVDNEGVEWTHSEDEPKLIGNGSKGRVSVSVTPDKRKKSIVYTRLEGLQVFELEEFTGGDAAPQLPF